MGPPGPYMWKQVVDMAVAEDLGQDREVVMAHHKALSDEPADGLAAARSMVEVFTAKLAYKEEKTIVKVGQGSHPAAKQVIAAVVRLMMAGGGNKEYGAAPASNLERQAQK
eukprot:1379870-Lingulodinium_polyedra.AAC.1